jgi:hypothetical protein
MLADLIRKGVSIKGLARLLDGGGVVGGDNGQVSKGIQGSYTVKGNEITFYNDNSGDREVNILPYVAGAISYTQMQGRETISGEFTGCAMAIYNDAGSTRVCHVDTAKPSEGEAPSKTRWANMKEQSGFELAEELTTAGMLPKFLDNNTPDASFVTLSILGVATPVIGITSYYVVKTQSGYRVVGVG